MVIIQKTKNAINKQLGKLPTYNDGVPVKAIDEILRNFGYLLVQEDGTPFEAIFCGDNSRTTIDIGVLAIVNDNGIYSIVENSSIFISWYKMASGRYEIVSYLT